MRTPTRVAGVVAGLSLSLGVLAASPPSAEEPAETPPVACAEQLAQVDRAEDALARLTAVFEKQATRVEEATELVAAADNAAERNAARKALREAKAGHARAEAARTAQQQRLTKAVQRLEKCQAAQPV